MNQHDGEKLQKWLDDAGWSIDDLAGRLKISRQTVYYHIERAKIGDSFKRKLQLNNVDVFDKTYDSPAKESPKIQNSGKVIEGHDNNHKAARVHQNTFVPPSPELNLIVVPLKVQGGFLKGYENRVFMDQLEYYHFPWVKGRCFDFEVEDFSMSPYLEPHDHVVCTEILDHTWMSKGKIYVIFTTEGKCIKFFDRIENDNMYLVSLNEEYNPVDPIPLKSIKRIFFKERVIKV